jgi:hypothetical protein
MKIITIDPGKYIGWAMIHDTDIVSCGTVTSIDELPTASGAIIEMPRVYPNASKWKGDPQQIVRLAMLAQRIADRYDVYSFVEPRRWRGMVPEAVLRGRTEALLDPLERARTVERDKLSPHAWDALGIAVWALGRRIR